MHDIRRTRAGVVVETTDTQYGMLAQGGIAGRAVLVKTETLRRLRIDPADMDRPVNEYGTTDRERLLHEVADGLYDLVIRRGHKIE